MLAAGTSLGSYEILELLGAGGMGEVYRARDTRLNRSVAIKVLPRDLMADPDRQRRFLQEARAASALNHPAIVTVYDIAAVEGVDFLVMEYVRGRSLDALIASGELSSEDTVDLAIQIAGALAVAHAAGIVHRDIKPANIIVTPESQAKILDFGLAKLVESTAGPDDGTTMPGAPQTQPGMMMGTAGYMSPEQALGERVDARTDLFSFGAVLYEMATRRRAFPKALDWTPPRASAARSELDRITFKLLEADRELRYQTAADAAADLKRLQRAAPAGRTRLRWAAAAAVVALVAIIVAAFIVMARNREAASRNQWVQLTHLPDPVGQPALSPDGRMVTFIRGPGTFFTPGQVYVKVLPDGEPRQLTKDRLRKLSPVFSPDGSRIAYSVLDEKYNYDTWVVPVLGGEPRLWLPNSSGLAWIDKSRLLFSEIKTGIHLAAVTAEESRAGQRDLFVPAHERGMIHRSYPSPDGNWALLVEMDERTTFLPCRLVAIDGGSPSRQVGPPGATCTFAAWSPDGRWMYFSSGVRRSDPHMAPALPRWQTRTGHLGTDRGRRDRHGGRRPLVRQCGGAEAKLGLGTGFQRRMADLRRRPRLSTAIHARRKARVLSNSKGRLALERSHRIVGRRNRYRAYRTSSARVLHRRWTRL
jgi:serine/threonine protein kinase